MWYFCYLSLITDKLHYWYSHPGTASLARLCSREGAQYSLWLSLRSDSLSHRFSLTSHEIWPFLVALSVTSASFSLCSLLCSAAPRGLLGPLSLWPEHTHLSAHNSFLPEVISAWQKQLYSSCHVNDILIATWFFLNSYKLDFEMSKTIMKCNSRFWSSFTPSSALEAVARWPATVTSQHGLMPKGV